MSHFIQLSGPNFSRSAVIEAGALSIVVGRDQHATIPVPDPERTISRKHLALDFEDSGVRVTVLSTVNGISTREGDLSAGQQVVLRVGESVQFGSFSLAVVNAPTDAFPAGRSASSSDPFAALNVASAKTTSVFDNAFFRPASKPSAVTPSDGVDPFAAFVGGRGTMAAQTVQPPRSANFGAPTAPMGVSTSDPMSSFANSGSGPTGPTRSIDEFLGVPVSASGSLGAANLLRPGVDSQNRQLASDHVHDFNLPFRSTTTAPGPDPFPVRAGPEAAIAGQGSSYKELDGQAFGLAAGDPWADIQSDWQTPASLAAPQIAAQGAREPIAFPNTEAFSDKGVDPFADIWSAAPTWQDTHSPETATAASADAFAPTHAFGTGNPTAVRAALDRPTTEPSPTSTSRAPVGDTSALTAFCKGLGVPNPNSLDDGDWEKMGIAVKTIVEGLTELMSIRAEVKRELRASDRTMIGAQDNNPLKSGMAQDELLQYVLFNPAGVGGYMPVNRALEEALNDLRVHEFASVAAVRAAVEGTINEFAPKKLLATLETGKSRLPQLFGSARLWDAYVAHFEKRSEHMADWLEQMFNRHFMPTYSRESWRMQNSAKEASSPADQVQVKDMDPLVFRPMPTDFSR